MKYGNSDRIKIRTESNVEPLEEKLQRYKANWEGNPSRMGENSITRMLRHCNPEERLLKHW